jgi:2-(1,2-epoxy-1,2-dihydrophenyl)acetyl-CoA isomerase
VQDRGRVQELHDWFQIMLNLEKPVIAAVDGAAYGGGFGLALGADFILLSERARLCSVFSRIGLIPDVSVIFTLPRMVGLQRAKEIAMTGRPVYAEEAKQIGIAMEVYPVETLYKEADKLAQRLALSSTKAQGMTKRAMNQSFTLDATAAVEVEALMQSVLFQSDYHKDAINRFVNKQPLKFNWEDMAD